MPHSRLRRLRDLVALARPDHWFKNVFVLPGVVVAWTMDPDASAAGLPLRLVAGRLQPGS